MAADQSGPIVPPKDAADRISEFVSEMLILERGMSSREDSHEVRLLLGRSLRRLFRCSVAELLPVLRDMTVVAEEERDYLLGDKL